MLNNIIYSDSPSKKASYITEDGKFINLQENKIELIGYQSREVTHTDYVYYLHNQGKRIRDLNIIRINDGAYIYINEEAYIELPQKEITTAQYNALLVWLDFLSLNSNKTYVAVGIGRGGTRYPFLGKKNPDGMLPEDIIKEIKRIYNETI